MGQVQRRLAAILAADVVGYSRLMAKDETGTLTALKAHLKELIKPEITNYGGRLVKLMGDGALVEFNSAVEAVNCAVSIQSAMVERNRAVPEDLQIVYRVGINVGDVIIEGDDIYGDGVNIAARIEPLSEPGGVCISATAYDQVFGKLDLDFKDMGEHKVKNMERPLHVYGVTPQAAAAGSSPEGMSTASRPRKPVIAVLPLSNISGDPEQEYFADGMSEDLITELSRFQSLAVIARNSTFVYKNQAAKIQDVARELGADYVLEGSIRKAANRVRVTVQLIDGQSGAHLWADRYDRELTDIFALQDELTRSIVATISGRLEIAMAERITRKEPTDLDAYDYMVRARVCHHRRTREDNEEALRLLDKALELDPKLAAAYAWKCCTIGQAWAWGFRPYTDEEFNELVDFILVGYAEDENDLECLRVLSDLYMESSQFDKSERYQRRAFMVNPNDPRIVAQRGELATWRGDPDEGIKWIKEAIRLDPYGVGDRSHLLGRAYFGAERYEEALNAFKQAARPKLTERAFIAACYAMLKQQDAAEAVARKILDKQPDFSSAKFSSKLTYEHDRDKQRLAQALRKAGLPE